MKPLRDNRWILVLQQVWPLFPAAIFLLGFLVIVVSYLVGLSLSQPLADAAKFPSLVAVQHVMEMPVFRESLYNTLLFVVCGTPVEVMLGLVVALLLYRNFRARNLIRSVILIPLAVPALVTAILLFIIFDFPGGHVNHLLLGRYDLFPRLLHDPINWRSIKVFALGISLLGKVWRDLPISVLILSAGLNAIDPELFDAAKTMGASFKTRFRLIIVPLLLPSISAVILLRSLEMWKEFIFPFILAGKYNLLGTLIEALYNNWGRSHEAAVVALILVACIIVSTGLFMWLLDMVRRRLTGE